MKFEQALNIINTKYNTRMVGECCAEIDVLGVYDGFNKYYVAIKERGDECYLDDYGNSLEVLGLLEDDIKKAASEYNITIKDNHIIKRFLDLNDINIFIEFLDKISN